MMSDAINPDHYKRLPAEAIEIIEAMIAGAPDNKAAYLHGQAAKYDLRLWQKGKSLEDYLADLGKHIWYALRLESHLLGLIEKQKADEQQKAADLQSLKDHPFGKMRQPAWTPKVGDWVKIKKPSDTQSSACIWVGSMNKYDGQIIEVKQLSEEGILHDNWGFMFDWLEPAEQPVIKDFLTAKPDPGEGYRLLSKDPPEKLLDTDEGLFACGFDGQQWLSVNYSSGEQLPSVYYRRKIEPAKAPLNSDKIPEGYRKLGDSSIEPRQVGDLYWSVSKRRYVAIVLDHLPYANRDNWAACRKIEPVIKQSSTTEPPDGWRWLERGELIRNGDKPVKGDAIPLLWIGTPCCGEEFILRRNRFEVGEKVVDCRAEVVFTVQHFDKEHQIVFVDGVSDGIESKHFAPYIEETK